MDKISVCTYSLRHWRAAEGKDLRDTIDWVADSGADGIEFVATCLAETKPDDPVKLARTLRKRCEKRGLPIVGYCAPGECLGTPAEQAQAVDRLKREADVAAEFGVPSMRHDVTHGFPKGWKGPKTFPALLKKIVPVIREVSGYAAERGITNSLENHGFYMQASERVTRLIDAVDHPRFALTMDMGNFLCVNEDPVQAVKNAAGYAVHVHIKDFHIKPKKQAPLKGWIQTPTPIAIRSAILGHGNIDIPAQLKALKRARYKGYLSIEVEGLEEPRFAVAESLAWLRGQLKTL